MTPNVPLKSDQTLIILSHKFGQFSESLQLTTFTSPCAPRADETLEEILIMVRRYENAFLQTVSPMSEPFSR